MIELEKTFLAKYLPEGLQQCESKEIIDLYIPKDARHPFLRIRKNGDRYVITKKRPVTDGDASEQTEETIVLNEQEFAVLNQLDAKRIHKIRYKYPFHGNIAEFDVFLDKKKGLVVVDFEFENAEQKQAFEMPDFCLADVTQEEFIAGGMVAGKSYQDLEIDLDRFGYLKIDLE